MAPQVWHDFVALVCAHPVVSAVILVFFTPPFFPVLKFFSPLLISTALFMLLLFTMGPKRNASAPEEDEDWTSRSGGDGEKVAKRMKPDGSWKDWVKGIEESSISWMSSPRSASRLPKNWKNDETVSILEEASWGKDAEFMSAEFGEDEGSAQSSEAFMPTLMAPSELFKVDSGLHSAIERSIYSDMEIGEDTPELEDVTEHSTVPVTMPVAVPVAEPVRERERPVTEDPEPVVPRPAVLHQPLETLQIPGKAKSDVTESPSTDVDDDSPAPNDSRRLLFSQLKKTSLNANSMSSDADTPEAANLSLSGKLKQMEKLGELLHDAQHAEETGQELPDDPLLQPTTAEQVDDVKDQLESFVTDNKVAASAAENRSAGGAPPESKLGNEAATPELPQNDTNMEIFPTADPAKMKLHPPVKLDVEHLEKKLGASLSMPKGEGSAAITQ